ncbi:uncharacterized protein GGS22DRAFT_191752 [Annulohypoxylon maeteangense]|uniref:uncharacterized protein n=1 Tax=Annulohypoxylon maeteangense TaxID=1927788 RepID=UPI002008901F|nr:uncharacterized protein GGS22DRAFT_191752 [Annulohypoxylon maeteangense]KAI0882021.1 hypothetical protein GGS22DRAFT_191752 [Annulohypoxylon maeteangense]
MKARHSVLSLGLLCIPAGIVYGASQQVLGFQDTILSAIGIDGLPWPFFGSADEKKGAETLSKCNVPFEVLDLLSHAGVQSADCSAAAHLAESLHDTCSKHPGCHLAGPKDNAKPSSDKKDAGWRASKACAIARFLLEPSSAVMQASEYGEAYEAAVRVNWSKDCWLQPRCILQPSSAEQVSWIMQIIQYTGTRFAIRSGGHNPNRGWANIGDGGVLIDTSRLDEVVVSPDASTVEVGPGNRWIRVYEKLEGTRRSVLGGRTPDVGVGGLLLGCGIPSFSSEFGLACDYVREYEVVLGNGTIVVANQETNADLWWALKGGGSNFGIVTKFVLETIPVDRIWYEARIYGPDESRRLLRAVREYQAAAEEDEKASFAFSLSNNHTIVAFVYSAPVEFPPVFQMFRDIPFQRHFIEPSLGTPYTIAKAFETVLGDRPAFKRDIIAVSTKPDLSLYEEGYDRWLELSKDMMGQFDCMMTFGIQPVTSSAIIKSNARGNPLNLSPEGQQWYTSVIQWQDDKFDDLAHQAVKTSGGAVREIAKRKGILLDFEFLNDATWDQHPIASYGEENVRKLREIAQRYDPAEVFQKLQGDGFLLHKMP